jgi:hypothetical protein
MNSYKLLQTNNDNNIYIEKLAAANEQISWPSSDSPRGFFHLPPKVKLDYKYNNLNFCFTGINLLQGINKYFYQLSDIDKNWVSTDKTEATYLSLPSGNYTFKVKAMNSNGSFSKEATIYFEITPPFWQTWWFRTIIILIVIGTIFYLIRRREKTITQQNALHLQMSELRMQALQSQMNPHFIFNSLNSIQTYIVNNNPLNAASYLSKFSKLIRRILDNSNSTLLPLEQIIDTLKMYVEIEAFRFNQEFTYEFIIDNDETLMNMALPPMLLQPFVENAIWHGIMPKKGDKKLIIQVAKINHQLVCTIEDNGVGRNANHTTQGHISRGEKMTKGMLESLKQIKNIEAVMEIIDKQKNGVAAGTTIIITIPISLI